jgi:molecular chaperone GrpE
MTDVKNGAAAAAPSQNAPTAGPEGLSPELAAAAAAAIGTPVDLTAVLEAEKAALEAEKAELKDKLLRTLADMENLRRRTERDVADARAYGAAKFARDMLDVADNLRRGIESVPAEERASAHAAFLAFLEGVELTERDMLAKLERNGVKKLEPMGQKFDPNLHQAMFEAPSEHPKGHVFQVVQSGFTIGDRVLRPAFVGVSSGPPPAA